MTKAQYYTATSIDGFIAGRDNSLDWLVQAPPSPGKKDRFSRFFAGVMLGEGTALLPRRLSAAELRLATVGQDARFVFLTYQVTRRASRKPIPLRKGSRPSG